MAQQADLQKPGMININLDSYPELACEKCGCVDWEPTTILKKVPGLALGRSGDVVVDITYFRCQECKKKVNYIKGGKAPDARQKN